MKGSEQPEATPSASRAVRRAAPEMRLPRDVGDYTLLRRVASGGFGDVYLARRSATHESFVRPFAIKIIHPHLARDADFASMFADEVHVASLLQHPNICSCLDAGERDGFLLLVMEFLVGRTLREVLRELVRVGLPEEERVALALEVGVAVADALAYAHEVADPMSGEPLHLVHRDVCPANVFLGFDGRVSLLDFGIARFAGRSTETVTGTMKGHLAYMAPEQFSGPEINGRTDLWALGVLLHEALMGARLFRRDTDVRTMHAVLTEPVPDLPRAVPKPVAEVVRQMLMRDPGRRPASAAEVAEVLRAHAPGGAVVGTLGRLFPGAGEQERKEVREELFASPEQLSVEVPLEEDSRPSGARVGPPPSDEFAIAPDPEPARTPRRTWALALGVVACVVGLVAGFASAPGQEPVASPAPAGAASEGAGATSEGAGAAAEQAAESSAEGPAAEGAAVEATAEGVVVEDGAEESAAVEGTAEEEGAGEPVAASADEDTAAAARADRARRSRRARPITPVGRGEVLVVTPGGWATVYLGARRLGETPARFELPAGRHRLRLVDGASGETIRVGVRVRADELTRVARRLP
ncbi:MAG TPA: serine/threonine-protein kinase [Polyangiaceae bacterium LLY-WYZ-15_(1-7)]|nr:hypothetical protein [Sandaracinus sp.]MBJ72438.1 hypothetical protein [Sandaracinus sp.]HJL01294.1 serine/threonine-protein kinase [Polyangiaceae bacterium LLY-WYZ-15_(1-7)]HJL10124.1 serine/threonine-protein kinase [Polyangiaceae bacterium LLY-WYZ-15_(1-7)]HJL37571.1 serine/threonine-protein kinase [Polyangiaceae bacterium LLY-WYZ-15_(1-7)]